MGICFSSEKNTSKITPENIYLKKPKILKIDGKDVNRNSNIIHSINPIRKKWKPKSKIEKRYPLKKNKINKKKYFSNNENLNIYFNDENSKNNEKLDFKIPGYYDNV